jgi:WD40 repeat protein
MVQSERHQLMQDKMIKVWDIRNFRCLQTLFDKTTYHPDDVIGAVLFDSERSQMISSNTSLMRWPVEVLKGSGVHGHACPVVQVVFNKLFEDAISGDQSGTVCVWNVKTGRLRFRCTLGARMLEM